MTSKATVTPRGRYSLDDAARMRRMLLSNPGAAPCPRCGAPLTLMMGENHHSNVWFVRCEECHRSIVIEGPPYDASIPEAAGVD